MEIPRLHQSQLEFVIFLGVHQGIHTLEPVSIQLSRTSLYSLHIVIALTASHLFF